MEKLSIKDKKLEAIDLNVYYGEKQVLKNVNMAIKANTVTAFIGPSGCGKSTFLRTFNRMNDYVEGFRKEGDIIIDGKDIYQKMVRVEELRKKVGMVFQKPNPFPKSIFDNVAYGPRLTGGMSKADLNDLVEKSLRRAALWDEVKDRLKASALGLSGGQQQRVAVARALAMNPSLLLADEPTGNLDTKSADSVFALLRKVSTEQGTSVLFVTHNPELAERCDKTLQVIDGKMV